MTETSAILDEFHRLAAAEVEARRRYFEAAEQGDDAASRDAACAWIQAAAVLTDYLSNGAGEVTD